MKKLFLALLLGVLSIGSLESGQQCSNAASAIVWQHYADLCPRYTFGDYFEQQGTWRHYYYTDYARWEYHNGCFYFIERDGSSTIQYCY